MKGAIINMDKMVKISNKIFQTHVALKFGLLQHTSFNVRVAIFNNCKIASKTSYPPFFRALACVKADMTSKTLFFLQINRRVLIRLGSATEEDGIIVFSNKLMNTKKLAFVQKSNGCKKQTFKKFCFHCCDCIHIVCV